MADRAFLDRMSKEFAEGGKLIEAGWIGLRIACELESAPALQLEEMRMAFFAGAQHLFGSIMGGVLDPGLEETEGDMRRLDLIDAELKEFIRDFELRYLGTKGSA